MSEKVYVTPEGGLKIKELSVFDLPKLCRQGKSWFINLRYDFFEKENLDKETDRGRIVDIEWHGKRKVDDYARFWIRVGVHAKHVNNIKVDNKMLDSGFLDITVEGWIELDYINTWEKNNFSRFLGRFYNKYIIKSKVNHEYRPKLEEEVDRIRDVIKEQLHFYK